VSKIHSEGIVPDRQVKGFTFDDRDPSGTAFNTGPQMCLSYFIGTSSSFELDFAGSTYGPGIVEYIELYVLVGDLTMVVHRDDPDSAGFHLEMSSGYYAYRFPITTDYLKFINSSVSATPILYLFCKMREATK